MKTLFINGSPKGRRGNSGTFIETITSEMKSAYVVKNLIQEKVKNIVEEIPKYDRIIIVMPLYIHTTPAIVTELFEEMKVNTQQGKQIGYIVQAGFEESETAKYLVNYLQSYTKRMQFGYMGTIVKPGVAGLSIMPKFMFNKLFKQLRILGKEYDETHAFSKEMIEMLGDPYTLSKKQVKLLTSKPVVMINKAGFCYFLRKNKAYRIRRDKPFLLRNEALQK
ncbi:MAG: hypothetical protein ACK5LC_11695 [Coprobacillaceae bacterium]